jgi:hypothetical protein
MLLVELQQQRKTQPPRALLARNYSPSPSSRVHRLISSSTSSGARPCVLIVVCIADGNQTPVPEISALPSGVQTWITASSVRVSAPVLSEEMNVVDPSS